eukprot:5277833-Alexandrium_andersonii.AAC.1
MAKTSSGQAGTPRTLWGPTPRPTEGPVGSVTTKAGADTNPVEQGARPPQDVRGPLQSHHWSAHSVLPARMASTTPALMTPLA